MNAIFSEQSDSELPRNGSTGISQDLGNSFHNFLVQSKIVSDGYISKSDFKLLQDLDDKITNLTDSFVHEGVICVAENGEPKVVVPEGLIVPIIYRLHYLNENNHLSKSQIEHKIKENYYMIDSQKRISEIVDKCGLCHLAINTRTPRHTYYMGKFLNIARTTYFVDILSGVGISEKGERYIFWR